MEFSLCCPCGETLIVSDIDAGLTRGCRCGVIYQVPSLDEMGQYVAAGEVFLPAVRFVPKFVAPQLAAPEEQTYSEAEKLQALDQRGRLPFEQNCIICNFITKDLLIVHIDCEQAKTRPKNPLFKYVAIGLLSPIDALHHYIAESDEKEIIGQDVSIRAPLRICASCAPPLYVKPAALREKMLTMRLYQPLFHEYPEATIRIVD